MSVSRRSFVAAAIGAIFVRPPQDRPLPLPSWVFSSGEVALTADVFSAWLLQCWQAADIESLRAG